MKRLLFCLIMAAVLLLSASALACEHTDSGQVADHELEEVNKIPPQIGVEGSVDLCCPVCHEIIYHDILPALIPEAEHPASSDAENPPAPQPDPEPVPPQQNEPQPDPEPPQQPEQPVQPEQPAASVPQQPEKGAAAERPVQPESPAIPAGTNGNATVAAGSNAAKEQLPPKAQDVTANVPAQTGGGTSAATGTATPSRRRTISRVSTGNTTPDNSTPVQAFPFRRLRMNPKPGIYAEAAGVLLWPVYGTPFQSLWND